MLFSGFLILFLTVIIADGASIISSKYAFKDEVKEVDNSNENTPEEENRNVIISQLLNEKAALYEEENTTTCGQAYKDCIGKIDQEEPYNEVCSQTLQCTADYFECRMKESNSTIKALPTRQTLFETTGKTNIKLAELEL